jgi:hypothetical protein
MVLVHLRSHVVLVHCLPVRTYYVLVLLAVLRVVTRRQSFRSFKVFGASCLWAFNTKFVLLIPGWSFFYHRHQCIVLARTHHDRLVDLILTVLLLSRILRRLVTH